MLNIQPVPKDGPNLSESNDEADSSMSASQSNSLHEDGTNSFKRSKNLLEQTETATPSSQPMCEDGSSVAESEFDNEALGEHRNSLEMSGYPRPIIEDGSSMSESEEEEEEEEEEGEEENNVLATIPHSSAQTPQVLVDNSSDVHVGPHYQYNGPVTVKQYITVNGKQALENGNASSEVDTELPTIKNVANFGLKSRGIDIPEDAVFENNSADPLVQRESTFLTKQNIWIGTFVMIILIITITLGTTLTGTTLTKSVDPGKDLKPSKIKISCMNKDIQIFEGADSIQWVVNIDSEYGHLKTAWYGPGCKKIEKKDKVSPKYVINEINLANGSLVSALTVNKVSISDRGLYKLEVISEEEKKWDYFTLKVQSSVPLPNEHIVACYVAEWASRRTGRGEFKVENIDPTQCTHLIYAFANLNTNENIIESRNPSYDLGDNIKTGAYMKMTALKNDFPHLKVLIGMGGWAERLEKNYSQVAESPTRRKHLIESISDYLTKYNFDGLDLHWQYPAEQNGVPADKENFVYLVKELREKFDEVGKNWILTAPLGVIPDTIQRSYNIPEISKYLHYMFALCYAYHGFWDQQTGPNAPLKPIKVNDKLNVESSIRTLLQLGAPAEKLVLGLALNGRSFNLRDESQSEQFGAPTVGEGFIGNYVQETGSWGYNEICEILKMPHSNWVKHWDPVTHTPYITNRNKFISYDNETSLAEKVNLALEFNLAGVIVYALDTDDFRGYCADSSGPTNYPLMRAINNALYAASFGSKVPC